jgi:hypothetical protein
MNSPRSMSFAYCETLPLTALFPPQRARVAF